MTKPLKHEHLIVTCRAEKLPGKNEEAKLAKWMTDLVKQIGMKKLLGPYVGYVDVEGNKGLTGVCIIETSHIAVHIWNEPSPQVMQLDVYSCSTLNTQDVFDMLYEFNPTSIDYTFIDRENSHWIKALGKEDYENDFE
jgi:S-adenosylmethionine/arginine decarboxylase-like enzyme